MGIDMDDFGTGYSSLNYLRRFPFDKVKIDRTFIKDIAEKDGSWSIVQAVVSIAKSRNIVTTAEGVETQEQLDLLRVLGCTEMQGYLFSRIKAMHGHHSVADAAPRQGVGGLASHGWVMRGRPRVHCPTQTRSAPAHEAIAAGGVRAKGVRADRAAVRQVSRRGHFSEPRETLLSC